MSEQINVTVTDISVTIEDGIKKNEDYAPARKASVTLRATVAEGDDPQRALEWVRRLADSKVHEIIHNRPQKPVEPPAAPVAVATPAAVSSPSSQPSEATGAAPGSKAALEAEAVKAAGGTSAKFPDTGKAEKPKGKAASKAKAEDKAATEADKPEEITDLDLTAAVTKRNNEINNPQAISALLVKYGGRPAPKQVRDIPVDQRAAFLEELKVLK